MIVSLEKSTEKIVIDELDIDFSGGLFPIRRSLGCCVIGVFSCLIFIHRVSPFFCDKLSSMINFHNAMSQRA